MKIIFRGVRGSIASPMSNRELSRKMRTALELLLESDVRRPEDLPAFMEKLPWYVRRTAGGNTTCMEVEAGGFFLILDAGTGLRCLGQHLIRESGFKPVTAHILISHTHWDHISGIPFFAPAFHPESRITVYSPLAGFEENIRNQQRSQYFPAPLQPTFSFVQLEEKESFSIEDVKIDTIPLNHPGGCHAYRIRHEGKQIVYATDSEYKNLTAEALRPFTDFFRDSDLLIFDAQYTMPENIEKEDWGHSNVFTGIDMALESEVKAIAFTHHNPTYDDRKLSDILDKARAYLKLSNMENHLRVYLAYEGLKMIL